MILSRGKRRENAAQLHFRRAVAAGGFDVVDAQFERAVDGGLEVRLVLRRDFFRLHILPFELVAHAAAGKDGHRQFGAAKASVFHQPQFLHRYTRTSNIPRPWSELMVARESVAVSSALTSQAAAREKLPSIKSRIRPQI